MIDNVDQTLIWSIQKQNILTKFRCRQFAAVSRLRKRCSSSHSIPRPHSCVWHLIIPLSFRHVSPPSLSHFPASFLSPLLFLALVRAAQETHAPKYIHFFLNLFCSLFDLQFPVTEKREKVYINQSINNEAARLYIYIYTRALIN